MLAHAYFESYLKTHSQADQNIDMEDVELTRKDDKEQLCMKSTIQMFIDRGVDEGSAAESVTMMFQKRSADGNSVHSSACVLRISSSRRNLLFILLRSQTFGVLDSRKIEGVLQDYTGMEHSDLKIHQVVVVSKKKATKNAKTELLVHISSLNSSAIPSSPMINMFVFEDLMFMPPRHCLVPEHFLVHAREEKALLRRLFAKKKDMPRLLADDPVASWYGWEKGSIVKFLRRFGGCNQEEIFYRVVT
jgi:DNA-directed RNA polymerase subunit H (RpoH/RPB5)